MSNYLTTTQSGGGKPITILFDQVSSFDMQGCNEDERRVVMKGGETYRLRKRDADKILAAQPDASQVGIAAGDEPNASDALRGAVLVPREPTPKMLRAAFAAMYATPGREWKRMKAENKSEREIFDAKMLPRWEAMLNAAGCESGAEPVAWYHPDNVDPGQSVTFDPAVRAKWPHLHPVALYAAPTTPIARTLDREGVRRSIVTAHSAFKERHGRGDPSSIQYFDALTDAILALPPAIEREGGWQPIETAPKDGTEILAFCVHPQARYAGEDFDRWTEIVVSHWIDHNDGGWTWNGMAGQFTHWRPLPLPPATDALKGEGK